MDIQRAKEILEQFKNKQIAVYGDAILDRYVFGEVDRISPEAPVPIVKIQKRQDRLGGSANVANIIHTLGGKVSYFFLAINPSSLLNLIEFPYHWIYSEYKVPIKERIIGNDHQIVRIDEEQEYQMSQDTLDHIETTFDRELFDSKPDVLILSDYAKGCMNEDVFRNICQNKAIKKIFVDTKPQCVYMYDHIDMLFPNIKEMVTIASEMSENDIDTAIRRLIVARTSAIMLKKGAEGLEYYDKDNCISVGAIKHPVFDVTGAGDIVIAVTALCDGICSITEAMDIAVHAAGVSVSKIGTSVVTQQEIINSINSL